MQIELQSALVGGVAGAITGALGSWVTGYWGPRRLELKREADAEQRIWGPRKDLIREMLKKAAKGKGRSFKTLKRVTGTPDDDLRRLLVELGARGFTRSDGEEAWIFMDQRPLEPQEPDE